MDYTGQTFTETVKIYSRGNTREVTYTYTLEGRPNDAGMVRAWDNITPSDSPDFLGRGHWVHESEI